MVQHRLPLTIHHNMHRHSKCCQAKMTLFFAIAVITYTLALTPNTINAFSTAVLLPVSSAVQASWRHSTQLRSSFDKDRIKKAGAGITTKTPGDLCLYDPNEDGKMQGSNTLLDRIDRGASFTLSVAEETSPPAPLTLPPPNPTTKQTTATKPNIFTTNLTKLLKGELDSRFTWERSQYWYSDVVEVGRHLNWQYDVNAEQKQSSGFSDVECIPQQLLGRFIKK